MGCIEVSTRLEALEDWAAGLLGQLEPAARNKLARSIGQALRRNQQQRIIAQRNPDGGKYAARKQRNLRGKHGRVKRKVQMFQRIRTASFLRVESNGSAIGVGFTGRVVRIARIHQYGLRDRAKKGTSVIKYEKRKLLGFTVADLDLIRNEIRNHLLPTQK